MASIIVHLTRQMSGQYSEEGTCSLSLEMASHNDNAYTISSRYTLFRVSYVQERGAVKKLQESRRQ